MDESALNTQEGTNNSTASGDFNGVAVEEGTGKTDDEKRSESDKIGRNQDGTFAEGNQGGPGRPPETEETKLIKKAQKELIEDYKQSLVEALKGISPVLVAKALEGDIPAIKEVNDRAMGKAPQSMDVTSGGKELPQPIMQINGILPDLSDKSGDIPE